MGYNNRELEIKLLVKKETSVSKISNIISNYFNPKIKSFKKGVSRDVYWKALHPCKADFIRLRYDSPSQLTMKQSDKGNNRNRIERDLDVTNPNLAHAFVNNLIGKPEGQIIKKYITFYLENEDTNIRICQIENDKRVFVEIEARTEKSLERLTNQVIRSLTGYSLSSVDKSFYQLFVKKQQT